MISDYPMIAAAAELARQDRSGRTATHKAANDAYAGELLPRLIPGTDWAQSKTWIGDLGRTRPVAGLPAYATCGSMFDHQRVFRQRGHRGPAKWKIAAVIAEPYTHTERDQFTPPTDWLEQCLELHREGVGVWMSHDLSAWVPGSTSLVVAAPGLLHRAPLPGFVSLTALATRTTEQQRVW